MERSASIGSRRAARPFYAVASRRRAASRVRRSVCGLTVGAPDRAAGWPASRCWRRCGRRRSCASASTTRITRRRQQGAAGRAAAVHQAVDGGDRSGRADPAAAGVGRVDHEAELGVVIGRRAHRVPAAQRVGLHPRPDLRERRHGARPAEEGSRSTRACKGFDTFAPIGPCIAIGLGRRAARGRRLGQRPATAVVEHRALSFPIEHLVEFITFVMTLEPGDIISTGTPAGIGPLCPAIR